MNLPDIHFDQFPDFASLRKAVYAISDAVPGLVKTDILGYSREGREILLVTLNDYSTGTPEERPAFFIMGDIHALEHSRMHSIYAILELLKKHEENALLSRVAFYFIPSINPDGVELVLNSGVPFIRSRMISKSNRSDMLCPADADGDGKILWMRWEHPEGQYAVDPEDPRLLIFRTPDTPGPYYKVVPEGFIQDWGGTEKFRILPGADWNRCFPAAWDAGPCYGGIIPLNEPELRLLADFLESRDNLCGAAALHVGGGCLVTAPNRSNIEGKDLAVLKRIAYEYGETMANPHYFSNQLKTPPWCWEDPSADRPGAFVDYLYQSLGIPGLDMELDGLYNTINFPVEAVDKIRNFEEFNDLQRRVMRFYDQQKDVPKIFEPWKKFQHPQLGEVEIGGIYPHVLYTRLLSEVPAEGKRLGAFLERFSTFSPRAALENLSVTPIPGEGLFKISVTPVNAGSMPTSILNRGNALWWKKVPRISIRCANGVQLLNGPRGKELGHLGAYSAAPRQEWIVKADDGVEELAEITFDAATGGKASCTAFCPRLLRESGRTNPDFILYAPKEGDNAHYGNENVTVLDLGGGKLAAFWLQSAFEQSTQSCCVRSFSEDGGKSWSEPRIVAGSNAEPETGKNRINHTTAVLNAKGRIYLFLSRNSGHLAPHENGIPFVCYSDDGGEHFSAEYELKFPHGQYDDPSIPTSWITAVPPIRLSSGKYAGGVTKYASRPDLLNRPFWTAEESFCEMYRIENLDDNPEPSELQIRWTALDDTVLTFPHRENENWHVMQEPSVVELPDGRLFMVGRSNSGSPCYAVSAKDGETWGKAKKLRYGDELAEILHPCSPCPIYQIGDGEYVLFIHNHNGNYGPWNNQETTRHRCPLYAVYGVYDPAGDQPIRFAAPLFFATNNGRSLGNNPRADMALYGSLTGKNGEYTLWYPDRKFFLCGKKLDLSALRKQEFPAKK